MVADHKEITFSYEHDGSQEPYKNSRDAIDFLIYPPGEYDFFGVILIYNC